MDSFSSIVISLKSEISLLKSSISVLEGNNAVLRGQIDVLTATNTSLKEVITSLRSANQVLSEENAKLNDKLGLASKNSSIPSSKDLYKIKRNKVKSLRSRGANLVMRVLVVASFQQIKLLIYLFRIPVHVVVL